MIGDVADRGRRANDGRGRASSASAASTFLVNNAALRGEKPLDEMTFAEWREVIGVILDGAFHCVQGLPAAAQQERRRRHRQYRRHERAYRRRRTARMW